MVDDGFQVGPETVVTLGYEVFDEEGELVGSSGDEPFEVMFGYGQLHSRLEQAIDGLVAGSKATAELSPRDAYGEWNQGAVLSVDPSEFPADTSPGDQFEAENMDGAVLVFKVLDVTPDAVLLDTNHPLAGQRVRFSLEVHAVRPATDEELEVSARRAQEQSQQSVFPHLVPPGHLLRRGDRRQT